MNNPYALSAKFMSADKQQDLIKSRRNKINIHYIKII